MSGREGLDVAKIDALLQARQQARSNKNWAEADRIRDELTAMDIVIEDGAEGASWKLVKH